ncbi:unnamed protein product, partial [Iphiclides podalirius]
MTSPTLTTASYIKRTHGRERNAPVTEYLKLANSELDLYVCTVRRGARGRVKIRGALVARGVFQAHLGPHRYGAVQHTIRWVPALCSGARRSRPDAPRHGCAKGDRPNADGLRDQRIGAPLDMGIRAKVIPTNM